MSAAANNGVAVDCVLILSDNLMMKTGKRRSPLRNKKFFWEGCGESHMILGSRTSERVDPVLKLFYKCEVMMTNNEEVRAGKANGTTALVKRVKLKRGESFFYVTVGAVRVKAALASSVKEVLLQHINEDITPREFTVCPKDFAGVAARIPKAQHLKSSCNPTDRKTILVDFLQLPFVSNSATTGHKLQGSGVKQLMVSEWKNDANWIYVVLSRVKERIGLFLRKELKPDRELFAIPQMLANKLRHFRMNCTRENLDEQDYIDICAD